MPERKRRLYFPVVAGVMTYLVVVNVAGVALRPLIPPPEPNAAMLSGQPYHQVAALQEIKWRRYAPGIFAEALREDKAVLLAIGRSASGLARHFDERIFTDPEVIERINRGAIPVRIDQDIHPEWTSAVLPVRQGSAPPNGGFRLAVLDSAAELLMFYGDGPSNPPEPDAFIEAWTDAMSLMASRQDLDTGSVAERLRALEPGDSAWPNSALHAAGLADRSPLAGRPVQADAWAWRALAARGLQAEAADQARELAASPLFDIRGGGFFLAGRPDQSWRVNPAKSALGNADAAAALARLGLWTGQEEMGDLARLCLDGIKRELTTGRRVYVWVASPPEEGTISPEYSVPISSLQKLSSVERAVAQDQFGLDGSQVTAIPHWNGSDPPLRSNGVARDLLSKAQPTGNAVLRGPGGLLNVSAVVAARHLEAGLLLGDPELIETGLFLAETASGHRVGPNEVTHQALDVDAQHRMIEDGLAFAELRLWQHQAGDESALEEGWAVLERTLARHAGESPGTLRSIAGDDQEALLHRPAPVRWFDADGRSAVAQAAMLLASYAALRESPADMERADAILRRHGGLADSSDRASSLMEASILLQSPILLAGGDEANWRNAVARYPGQLVLRDPSREEGLWQEVLGSWRLIETPGISLPPEEIEDEGT